jgi:hypothetical protein
MGTQRPPMRGRRHDSIALPGGRRVNDPDTTGACAALPESPAGASMPDDPSKAGKADNIRINIEQEHEVKYWSEKFGVSQDQLKSAMAKVGSMAKNVRDHLQHRS